MKTEFNTNEFFFAHGKQPRGEGRWVFSFVDVNGSTVQFQVPYTCVFSKAKRFAHTFVAGRFAGREGVHSVRVEVCS